jgi:hypothetical protein
MITDDEEFIKRACQIFTKDGGELPEGLLYVNIKLNSGYKYKKRRKQARYIKQLHKKIQEEYDTRKMA